MKSLLLGTGLLLAGTAFAQDNSRTDLTTAATQTLKKYDTDTTKRLWKTGGILNLNGAQTSLNNWAAGGDNFALSINSFVNLHAYYKKDKVSWDNNFDWNFGYIKTTSTGTRKNDDRLALTSKYGYALNDKLDIGALFDFRTQAFKGYTYESDGSRTKSSNFLAPAYVLFSPGLNYRPFKNFSVFYSPAALRFIIVNDDSLSAHGAYGVDLGKKVKTQLGSYLTANYTANITSTISYIGRVDLFSDYLNKPENIYFFMNNLFAVKLSKVLSATWNYNLIYDDKARLFGPTGKGARMQTQSIVGAGLMYKF